MNSTVKESKLAKRQGVQSPTIRIVNPDFNSWLDDPYIKSRLEMYGLKPFPWQYNALVDFLSYRYDEDGSKLFAYKYCGCSVPRQNGKSEIIAIRIILGLTLFGENQKYTSYNAGSTKQIFKRVLGMIENNYYLQQLFPETNRSTAKGKEYYVEAVDPKTGEILGRCDFETRAGGTGRGASLDVIFFDECQYLTEGEHAALSATVITKKNGQIYYFGTPPPVDTTLGSAGHGKGSGGVSPRDVFKNFRKESIKNGPQNRCYLEWGVSKVVSKDDIESIYRVNPSIGFKMSDGVELTLDALKEIFMDDERYAVEHLGYWASQDKERAIDITVWRDLKYPLDEYPINPSTHFALAVKFSYHEPIVQVAIAYKTGDEKICLEIAQTFNLANNWKGPLAEMIYEYYQQKNCVGVIIDGGDKDSVFSELQNRYRIWNTLQNTSRQGKIMRGTATDAVASTSVILSSIQEKSICHLGDPSVDLAVEDATKRQRGGFQNAIGFRSMSGKVDTNCLEAMALALNTYINNSQYLNVDKVGSDQERRSSFSFGVQAKKIF